MKKIFTLLLLLSFTNLVKAQDEFITTWTVDSSDLSIIIPTYFSYDYNYDIDWGDGNSTAAVNGNTSHTYALAGTYTVTITGLFSGMKNYFLGSSSNAVKLSTVEQWGTPVWYSMNRAFWGCENLIINATDNPDLSKTTDMSFAFSRATSLNLNISNWDVSNVTNMFHAFEYASSFEGRNIGKWDVSNVTNMAGMFYGATNFTGSGKLINIGKDWDVSNVNDFSLMFAKATKFNLDISNWDISSAQYMSWMFTGAEKFNQDISNWDISNLIDIRGMFDDATSFNQSLGNWDISNLNSMYRVLNNTNLSTNNYDKTLISWSKKTIQDNVNLGAETLKYCSATSARQSLIDDYGWSFDGDSKLRPKCGTDIISSRKSEIKDTSEHNIFSLKNHITIKYSTKNGSQVTIYNIKGQKVYNREHYGTLNLHLPIKNSGIYIVHVNNKDGVLRKKVFIE